MTKKFKLSRNNENTPELGLYKPEEIPVEVWHSIAMVSYRKFKHDADKYNTWSASPRCDACGELYGHYYVTNELWEKSGLQGWVCDTCLVKKIGRKLNEKDMIGYYVNLFEVKCDPRVLEKRLKQMQRKDFHDILREVYGITLHQYYAGKYMRPRMEDIAAFKRFVEEQFSK